MKNEEKATASLQHSLKVRPRYAQERMNDPWMLQGRWPQLWPVTCCLFNLCTFDLKGTVSLLMFAWRDQFSCFKPLEL